MSGYADLMKISTTSFFKYINLELSLSCGSSDRLLANIDNEVQFIHHN